MKALKILASIALTAFIIAAGLAAEALALVRFTALDPDFYGQPQHETYELASQAAVYELGRLVLNTAPASALRTTDPEEAYAYAAQALPPERLANVLENSAPEVARYLLEGGDTPLLHDYTWLRDAQQALVRSLLKPGVWELLPNKPELPILVPFTPKWSVEYEDEMETALILPRFYYGVYDNGLAAVAATALGAGWLLYLVWRREKKPFFFLTGTLLVLNSLLLLLPAVVISYFSTSLVQTYLSTGAGAGLDEWATAALPALVRSVVWPLRDIFFAGFLVSLSFGITQFTATIDTGKENAVRARRNLETI